MTYDEWAILLSLCVIVLTIHHSQVTQRRSWNNANANWATRYNTGTNYKTGDNEQGLNYSETQNNLNLARSLSSDKLRDSILTRGGATSNPALNPVDEELGHIPAEVHYHQS